MGLFWGDFMVRFWFFTVLVIIEYIFGCACQSAISFGTPTLWGRGVTALDGLGLNLFAFTCKGFTMPLPLMRLIWPTRARCTAPDLISIFQVLECNTEMSSLHCFKTESTKIAMQAGTHQHVSVDSAPRREEMLSLICRV